MFFHAATLKKGGRFYLCYIASVLPQKFSFVGNAQVISCDYLEMCDDLKQVILSESNSPSNRYSLRLSSHLVFGLLKIHLRKVNIFLVDLSKFENNLIRYYHNFQKEKRPRRKRTLPAVQNGTTNATDNLEPRGNDCVTVRNISDITLEDEILLNPNIVNDNFGEMPHLLDPLMNVIEAPPMNVVEAPPINVVEAPSMNVVEAPILPVMEVDIPVPELQTTDIVVPEINIEPPKENRKRKATHRETVGQIPDPVAPVPSESIPPMNRMSSEPENQSKTLESFISNDDINKNLPDVVLPESEDIEKILERPDVFQDFNFKGIPADFFMPYLLKNIEFIHFMEAERETPSDITDDESQTENMAELMEIDRPSIVPALNINNTILPEDLINADMQGNNTMRAPDASRDEMATSLLLPNVSHNRTVQGSLLPDTTQLNECGLPMDVPLEMTRHTDLPIDLPLEVTRHTDLPIEMLEISEIPNSTTEGFNVSIERTPVMVEDPPDSREAKERNQILREFWDPRPLFQTIAKIQGQGEMNVDVEKIVRKNIEAASFVTLRRAYVRVFTSLLKLKHSRCIRIQKKPDSTEIKHISIDLDNSQA